MRDGAAGPSPDGPIAALLEAPRDRSARLAALAGVAVRRVPGCAAATATVWAGALPLDVAATHPDTADLIEVQVRRHEGPVLAALNGAGQVLVSDTLEAAGTSPFAARAAACGVRCAASLAVPMRDQAVTLCLYAATPNSLGPDALDQAGQLLRDGARALVAGEVHDGERMAAEQLRIALASRPVIDQAKGVLMASLGCGPDEAFALLRRRSQHEQRKLVDLAEEIVRGASRAADPGR